MNRVYRYKSLRKFSLHDRIVVRVPLSRCGSIFVLTELWFERKCLVSDQMEKIAVPALWICWQTLFSNVVTRLITERYSIRSIFFRVVKRKYPAQQIRVRERETARYTSLSISVVYRWMKRKIYDRILKNLSNRKK